MIGHHCSSLSKEALHGLHHVVQSKSRISNHHAVHSMYPIMHCSHADPLVGKASVLIEEDGLCSMNLSTEWKYFLIIHILNL